MKWVLALLMLSMVVVVTGCGKAASVAKALEPPKSEPIKIAYQNGIIVSNGAIMVEDFVGAGGSTFCPGIIVKLESGDVVQVKLCLSSGDELQKYRFVFGEVVRCQTRSDIVGTENDKWCLVRREK